MRARKLRQELGQLLELLLRSDIAIFINPVIQQELGSSVTRVTWPVTTSTLAIAKLQFATLEEYSAYVATQTYSAVLYDGSLLQMLYDSTGNDIVGHRLCYYPCPFDIDEDFLRSEPLADVVDFYRHSSEVRINLRSPCRFDYDIANVRQGHPMVHFHLNRSHCRWAVETPLSVGHFVGFVFQHFYPDLWELQSFLREWSRNRAERTIAAEEEKALYVACGRVA